MAPSATDALTKSRLRRQKANCRERSRMHGLNQALDVLRQCVQLTTQHQKLSKIETLRLARNYIAALNYILHSDSQPSALEYAHMLSDGMSQTTTNLIASLLQVQPRLLVVAQQQRTPPKRYDSISAFPIDQPSPSNGVYCSPNYASSVSYGTPVPYPRPISSQCSATYPPVFPSTPSRPYNASSYSPNVFPYPE